MARPEKLDSIIYVVTPENFAFEYRIAGPFLRLPAFMIDLAIMGLIFFVGTQLMGLVLVLSPGAAFFAFFVALFVVFWFYGGICETFLNGQTPGKWLLGLRTLTYEGQPINGLQAIMRNLLRAADLLMPLVGFIVIGLNRRYQRLGDLVAGTIVLVQQRHWLTHL